jgi:hypothetical protein
MSRIENLSDGAHGPIRCDTKLFRRLAAARVAVQGCLGRGPDAEGKVACLGVCAPPTDQSSPKAGFASRNSQVTSTNEAVSVGIANGVSPATIAPWTSTVMTVASSANSAERRPGR